MLPSMSGTMKVREKSKDQFWPFLALGVHVEGGAWVDVPSGVGRFVMEAALKLGNLLVRPRSLVEKPDGAMRFQNASFLLDGCPRAAWSALPLMVGNRARLPRRFEEEGLLAGGVLGGVAGVRRRGRTRCASSLVSRMYVLYNDSCTVPWA